MPVRTHFLYLSQPARANVEAGIAAGAWGITDEAVGRHLTWLTDRVTGLEVLQEMSIGDHVIAAAGGPQPRVPQGSWADASIGEGFVERAISLGQERDTKTYKHRAVRLLDPLRLDLAEFRMVLGRPADDARVFPGRNDRPWTLSAWQSWRRRAFDRAAKDGGIDQARPYDLRHSFASLLLHEGRSVVYVAAQLGHDPRMTLTVYGHVIAELEDRPQITAEDAIRAAREGAVPVSYPRPTESSYRQ